MSNYRPICDESQRDLFSVLYAPEPEDIEWPAVDEISARNQAMYPNRILIEHSCRRCGQGFSSIKPRPQFCSKECYLEHSKPAFAERSRVLRMDPAMNERLSAARRAAGYPDPMRPEAVARRAMRRAAKNAVHRCLKVRRAPKTESVMVSVGYSARDLCQHLEVLFVGGMNWENYGEWEVDHIRPISNFPLMTPLSEINALSNLQPLWKLDNRRKHARVGI